MEIKVLKDALVAAAKKSGLEQYELYYAESSSTSAETLKDEISAFSSSSRGGISFRCIVNGKMGYAATELLTEEEMSELVSRAISNAKSIENEDEVFIFPGSEHYGTPNAKPHVSMSATDIRNLALDIQRRMYAASEKVSDGTQSSVFTADTRVYLYNSYGLELSNVSGVNAAYASAIVRDSSGDAEDAWDFAVGCTIQEMGDLPERTVEKAMTKFGGRSVPSGKYTLIISGETMSDLLATFSPAFSAKNAQLGLSRLAGKEGDKIAADCINITDDPMRPDYPAQTFFDGEGVATYRKNVIENGVLKTLLYDLSTAKKAGKISTGNGQRGGYSGPVTICPYCFCLEPGDFSEEELLRYAEGGIYITSMDGLHAGANAVSGDFSLQSSGYWIRNGKKAEYVKEFTVAGNFFDLLKSISKVADHVHFGIPGSVTDFASPAVLVSDMNIAGK